MSAPASPAEDDPPPRDVLSSRGKRLLYSALAVLSVAVLVGTAFTPWLLVNNPLLLVLLTPGVHNIVLAVPLMDPTVLILVAAVRRTAAMVCTFLLGGIFGYAMVRWVQKGHPILERFVDFYERLLGRAGAPLLVLAPLHTLAALAGAARVPLRSFLIASLIGQHIQVGLLVFFGDAVSHFTERALELISRYVLEATVGTVLLVLAYLVTARVRQGRWAWAAPRPPHNPDRTS